MNEHNQKVALASDSMRSCACWEVIVGQMSDSSQERQRVIDDEYWWSLWASTIDRYGHFMLT